MKPPFPYYGGKTRLADRIVAMLPAHRTYVEPFAGACAVLFAKPPSRHEIVNDVNSDLMTFFRVLRDDPLELARVCALTPHSRGEMLLSLERGPELSDVERARRTWVRLTQGRSASLRKTGWRHFFDPYESNASTTAYLQTLRTRILPAAERLIDVTLECRDALDVIRDYGPYPANLLYVDPPYLASTRQSKGYATEMQTVEQHEQLLDAVLDVKGIVLISGYESELYDRRLAGWDQHVFRDRNQTGGRSVEKLWANRSLDSALFAHGWEDGR